MFVAWKSVRAESGDDMADRDGHNDRNRAVLVLLHSKRLRNG